MSEWWEEREKAQAEAIAARREEQRRRDESALKPWRREPSGEATRASAILDGLKGKVPSLRSIVDKAQGQGDDFARLEREVEKGRPLSGLARHFYEKEKAQRDGESDAE